MRNETPARPSGHENDVAAPAPGDLELVRSFLSLHDHAVAGPTASLPPARATIARWFLGHDLAHVAPDDPGLPTAVEALEDLRTLVFENMGAARDEAAATRLDSLAAGTGVRIHIAEAGVAPEGRGVLGALGRVLSIAFLARVDGSWGRLRACANDDCRSVFFDRSKNRSARWCDMRSCGNQAKVRAYRERHRAAT